MISRRSIAALAAALMLGACGDGLDRGDAPEVINFSILSTENVQTTDQYWRPIIEDMEKAGLVSAMNGQGQREILVPSRAE